MKVKLLALLLLVGPLFANSDIQSEREAVELMQEMPKALNQKVAKTKKECLEYSKYLKEEAIPFIVSLKALKENEANYTLIMYDNLLLLALYADVALDNLNEYLSTLETEYFTDDRSYAFVMKFYGFNSALHREADRFIGQHYDFLKEKQITKEYSSKLSRIPEILEKLDTLNIRYSKHLVAQPRVEP
ncbi:hypothetical protein QEH52_19685 [Coraliomargarita sp. SDUM461003]|uniref:Uncharacterized protein n=1 Tax=Thalassobacterium maritimum TaxID=3041265 RepID=A0ABU1B2D4_9BACT|nr:hypothetical protein [Coraliomargarita sp. SDUM461003]MDQ8209750.1 hypothetical protein [Coraliomargarita sp. SDUM461003]